MWTCREKIEKGSEGVRGERGRQCEGRANIPAMDDEFKETSVGQGVGRDHAERMIAGLVPRVGTKRGEDMQEGVPSGTERGHNVIAKTATERELLRSPFPPSLPPFLLREGLPEV